jgi:hypothetical protein
MAMPQNFALLKTKIISPILFTLFRNKALENLAINVVCVPVPKINEIKLSAENDQHVR